MKWALEARRCKAWVERVEGWEVRVEEWDPRRRRATGGDVPVWAARAGEYEISVGYLGEG